MRSLTLQPPGEVPGGADNLGVYMNPDRLSTLYLPGSLSQSLAVHSLPTSTRQGVGVVDLGLGHDVVAGVSNAGRPITVPEPLPYVGHSLGTGTPQRAVTEGLDDATVWLSTSDIARVYILTLGRIGDLVNRTLSASNSTPGYGRLYDTQGVRRGNAKRRYR